MARPKSTTTTKYVRTKTVQLEGGVVQEWLDAQPNETIAINQAIKFIAAEFGIEDFNDAKSARIVHLQRVIEDAARSKTIQPKIETAKLIHQGEKNDRKSSIDMSILSDSTRQHNDLHTRKITDSAIKDN